MVGRGLVKKSAILELTGEAIDGKRAIGW